MNLSNITTKQKLIEKCMVTGKKCFGFIDYTEAIDVMKWSSYSIDARKQKSTHGRVVTECDVTPTAGWPMVTFTGLFSV